MKRRKFTPEFKRKVVLEAMRGDETVCSIAARHGVNPNQAGRCKTEAHDGLLEVLARGVQFPIASLFRCSMDKPRVPD